MDAARTACDPEVVASSVLSRRQVNGSGESRIPDIPDRLVEDARIFLLVIERHQTSYDGALDGLVRDAFGSADRLRAAAAVARAGARPTAEVDLLERAADRVERPHPRSPHSATIQVRDRNGCRAVSSAGGQTHSRSPD
jgi:hypothetical protein